MIAIEIYCLLENLNSCLWFFECICINEYQFHNAKKIASQMQMQNAKCKNNRKNHRHVPIRIHFNKYIQII